MAPKFSGLIDKAERFLSILDRREITAAAKFNPRARIKRLAGAEV